MILRKNFANNLAEMLGIFFTKNTPFKWKDYNISFQDTFNFI
jgi:hypothetical protein